MGRHRRADIQGLRALAVIFVVLYHAGLPLDRGFLGVDIFFAISGFVITQTLVRELEATGRIDLSAFYRRRAKRLLPALALMLATVTVAGIALAPAGVGATTALTGVFASLFASNFYLYTLAHGYFAVSDQLNPLLHTWTLGVEEQFYVVFPLLLVAAWRVGLTVRRARVDASILIAGVTAISFLLANAWSAGRGPFDLRSAHNFAFYGSPARAWEFGLGALAALALPVLRRLPQIAASALAAGAFATLLLCVLRPLPTDTTPTFASLIPPVAATVALLAAGAAAPAGPVSQFLGLPGMVLVGDLSYSLYLWHWPMIVFGRALFPGTTGIGVVAATASLIPAWLSYRYLENRIRFNPRIVGRAAVAVATACVAVALGGSATLAASQPYLPGAFAFTFHLDYEKGCDSSGPYGSPARPRCTWGPPVSRGKVVLIGDSNAGHFSEAVVAAAESAGYQTTIATMSDCPFVQIRVIGILSSVCTTFAEHSLRALVRDPPSLVIIGTRTDLYLGHSRNVSLAPIGSEVATDNPVAKQRLWVRGLRDELHRLSAAGVPVLLVHPVPPVPVDERSCANLLLWMSGCRGSISVKIARREVAAAVRVENAAARGISLVSTLDLIPDLCQVTCAARRAHGGAFIYSNANHLSVAGSRALTPVFYKAIVEHARPPGSGPRT